MSAADLERFLARVWGDRAFAEAAGTRPREAAAELGLGPEDAERVARLDWDAVRLAAESFEHKRGAAPRDDARPESPLRRLLRRIRRSGGGRPRRS